jgi:lipoprotein-releasing system permease protein
MSFEWFVARRYLTARRRQALISLISAVSIVGVAVGVMALVIALALMTGVQSEMRDRIVGSQAHIYVHRLGGVPFAPIDEELARMTLPGVAGGAPAITGRALLIVAGRGETPVEIKGIDPAREGRVTEIETAMIAGSLEALAREPGATDGVIIGEGLATSQGLKVGDDVTIMTPKVTLGFTTARPTLRVLVVAGIAKFGFYQVDAAQVFMSLRTAGEVVGADGPTMMQLRLTDLDDARRVRDELQTKLGPTYNVMDWIELNAPLYSALWLEKVAISTTIGLIVMVAALNIVASLVLLVMEKSRDIAILRTMGAPARAIRRIFVLQGLTIGLVGTLTGAGLGLIVSFAADRWHLLRLDGQVYQITHVPFRVQPFDVIVVVVSAIGVCLLATVYPSRQAARLDPAEALRNQ